MDSRNPHPDPQDRGKPKNQPGVGAPAKGESSGTNLPDDDATLVDAPRISSTDDATLVDADLDATLVDVDLDATHVDAGPLRGTSSSAARFRAAQQVSPVFEPGDLLGSRYEILKLLGEGGMGAVYKAMDRELNRPVALKLIKPQLAANPSILARFKQELLLAQQITHKNVIRIYDLGVIDGITFITMEFVEGEDLRALMQEKQKFPPEEAVEIMQQVCRALEAVHGMGVLHRDLKPQNIMRDKSGRILVMDFGLARTVEGDGMTQTGALVGTMEYMSPEQALAEDLDIRSDLFTVGLILYELLTGNTPFRADSALASLIKRTRERAVPVSDMDQTVPRQLSNIVAKCLERDPKLRYQTAGELLQDLDAYQSHRAAATLGFYASVKPWGQTLPWPAITGIASVLVLGTLAFVFRAQLFYSTQKPTTASALSLAVVPFQNASGDQSWDWLGPSLADMLSTDVGQSAHLRTVSSDRVQQVLHDLRVSPGTAIDSSSLSRVAEFTNADTLVYGQYNKIGDQIRIDATLQDRKHNRSVHLESEVLSQKDLSAAVDKLADEIRKNLTLSSDVVKELQAQSFKPTSTSVDALRDYNQGVQLLRQGNNLEAQKKLESATREDPQFAMAYSRLGEALSDLGYDAEAEQASRHAVDLGQSLPQVQRYFLEASLARVTKDSTKAIAAYENLAKTFPDDLDVQYALGSLYEDAGDFPNARTHYANVLQADSKNLDALLASGRVEIKAGDPQKGLDPLDRARHIAIDLDNQEQQALILQATGIAYKLLNKPTEALRNYQDSMDINQKLGQKRGVAASLVEIAQVQLLLGKPDAAMASYNQALKIRQDIGAKKEAGDTLIDLGDLYLEHGQVDKALDVFKQSLQIQRDANDEAYQSLCLNDIGIAYTQKGENEDALTYLQQALALRQKLNVPGDIADTLQKVGQAYSNLAQYDQAMTSYLQSLDLYHKANDKQGVALVSDSLGLVFGYQGRVGPAVGAMQDAVQAFRDVGDRSSSMAQALGDLADALARAGRGKEASKPLEEAQTLVKTLNNEALMAAIANAEGDVHFYQGEFVPATTAYQQALRLATHASDKDSLLLAKMNLAKAAVAQGRTNVLSDLQQVGKQADAQGRKYVSVASSVLMADAMIKNKDQARAKQELQRNLGSSEKLGLRIQTAKIYYLMGVSLRASGSGAEAKNQYAECVRMLDEIRKEQGADHLLDRADVKPMYAEATQYAQ